MNSTRTSDNHDRIWALVVGVVFIALTLVPYLIGYSMANGRPYMWLGYNLDDSCVYLSWMRQARDGAFIGYNLFTTEPQHGMALNPLFLLLGNIARFTGLPLLGVYHGSRLLLGLIMLMVVWRLIEILTPDRLSRKISYLCVCFSAGLGWLPLWWDEGLASTPVDRWQPEAITFLSLYLSPLFCASLALQAAIVLLLFQADRNQNLRLAVLAGICGFALGLVHPYDTLSLAAVWLTYLLLNSIRPLPNAPSARILWRDALIAGAMTLPAVLYIYIQLRTETVFKQRAAVPTLSPPIAWVLLGYGFTLALALFAVYRLAKPHASQSGMADQETNKRAAQVSHLPVSADVARLLIAWALANLLISYIPTPFQRKLLQGEHFPIAILAGIAVAYLLARLKLQSWKLWVTVGALILLLGITNIRFMLRDIANDEINLAQTKQQRPYLKPGEIEALHWIDTHVPRNIAVQSLPYLTATVSDSDGHLRFAPTDMSVACFIPGLTGHHVYCGHWGETPDYWPPNGHGKLSELVDFSLARTTDAQRIALLQKMKVGFLLYSQKDMDDNAAARLAPIFHDFAPLPSYLRKVHSNADADVYEVDRSIYQPETETKP